MTTSQDSGFSDRKNSLGQEGAESKIPDLSAVKQLGRYRSFLKLKAMGIAPRFGAKFDASDVVQQTLLEAHQKLDQFRGQTEPEMANWLGRMLANNMADAVRALRSQKRNIAKERPIENQPRSSIRGGGDWLQAEQTSPSLGAYRSEQMVQLSDAISELPESQKEVIVLHHLEGYSLAQVAEQTERSLASVAGLLYRGLKSLREKLG